MDSATARELQSQQQELQRTLIERQKLETQLQESRIVKQEFDQLGSDAKIFKMIGPVLVPQDRDEAATNVDKRLSFIETQIKQIEEKMRTLQDTLLKKQQEFQNQMAQASAATTPETVSST